MPCGYPVDLPLGCHPLYVPLTLFPAMALPLVSSPHLVHPQGIHWQDADVLVAVSDRMKAGGMQPFVCQEHDQSIHNFLVST